MAFSETGDYVGTTLDERGRKVSGSLLEDGARIFGLATITADMWQSGMGQPMATLNNFALTQQYLAFDPTFSAQNAATFFQGLSAMIYTRW